MTCVLLFVAHLLVFTRVSTSTRLNNETADSSKLGAQEDLSNSDSSKADDDGPSWTWVIVSCVFGMMLVVGLMSVTVYMCAKKHKKTAKQDGHEQVQVESKEKTAFENVPKEQKSESAEASFLEPILSKGRILSGPSGDKGAFVSPPSPSGHLVPQPSPKHLLVSDPGGKGPFVSPPCPGGLLVSDPTPKRLLVSDPPPHLQPEPKSISHKEEEPMGLLVPEV